MVAPAPSTKKTDVCITQEPICFGSFEYTFHPPAHRSVYADLHVGMCLTFGTIHYFVDSRGVFRSMVIAPRVAATPASAIIMPPTTSSAAEIASCNIPKF